METPTYNENMIWCDHCGEVLHNGDAVYFNDYSNEYLCEVCQSQYESTLLLFDYKHRPTKLIDISELPEIRSICISEISGDEVAEIVYVNGDEKKIDSSDERLIDYVDIEYVIYDIDKGIDCIDQFKERHACRSKFIDIVDNKTESDLDS